jgi:hypothetical protein
VTGRPAGRRCLVPRAEWDGPAMGERRCRLVGRDRCWAV